MVLASHAAGILAVMDDARARGWGWVCRVAGEVSPDGTQRHLNFWPWGKDATTSEGYTGPISPCAASADDGALAWVGTVDVEVPARCRQPPVVGAPQREQADHSLAAFPVAVENGEHHRVTGLDCGGDGLELSCGRIAQRSLPESDVAGCHVNVAGLGGEILERWMGLLWLPGDIAVPAVHYGESGADVPDRDHHIHHAIGDLQSCGAARDSQEPAFHELDLLLRVLQPRAHQQRELC